MARTANVRRRRPIPPTALTRRYMRRPMNGSMSPPYAAFHHVSADGTRSIWMASNGLLFCSVDDGATWRNPKNTGAANETSFGGKLAGEGLFVSSSDMLYRSTGDGQQIIYKQLTSSGTIAADDASLTAAIVCEGTATAFTFPAKNGTTTGGYCQHWGMWEIEYPWEAVGGLEIGDIILGMYHRSNDTVAAVAVTAGGTGYATGDGIADLIFTGGGGTGASGAAVIAGGVVTSSYLLVRGSGYTSNPTVTVNDTFTTQATLSPYLARKAAYIYVIRNGAINADAATMLPNPSVAGGLMGDPFVDWNQVGFHGMADIARHIHSICMGLDGYLYFTTGDQATLVNWATGDTGDHYRHCRIHPGGVWEQLAGAGNGFTAIALRDNGVRVMGNDADTYGSGQTQYIERWNGATKIDRTYLPAAAYDDWPIWNIVEVGSWGAGTGVLYAAVQRAGGHPNVGRAYAKLLKSVDGGATWKTIAQSGPLATSTGWSDFDFIISDRRRRIPTGAARFMITTQPDGNTDSRYYTVEL